MMRLSPVLPRSSAGLSPALLSRCPVATAPPSATVSGPRPQLHCTIGNHGKLSRSVSARCNCGKASFASGAGAANAGAAEGGSSSQLFNAAGDSGSASQQPIDADARPADAKASRRQRQAGEVVVVLLQEALRPLVEAQAAALREKVDRLEAAYREYLPLATELRDLAPLLRALLMRGMTSETDGPAGTPATPATPATAAAAAPGGERTGMAAAAEPAATLPPMTEGGMRLTEARDTPSPRPTADTAYLIRNEFVIMDIAETAEAAMDAVREAVQGDGQSELVVAMPEAGSGSAAPTGQGADGVLKVLDVFSYTARSGPNAGKQMRGLRFEAPPALQPRLFRSCRDLKARGLVLRDSLTREGRLLRRLRQPAFRQLQAAGRRPRWYAGVEIEVLGDDGRYHRVEFGAVQALPSNGGHGGRPPPARSAGATATGGPVPLSNRFEALGATAEEEPAAPPIAVQQQDPASAA